MHTGILQYFMYIIGVTNISFKDLLLYGNTDNYSSTEKYTRSLEFVSSHSQQLFKRYKAISESSVKVLFYSMLLFL